MHPKTISVNSRLIMSLLILLVLPVPGWAVLINVDADGFADDTDISTAFGDVTLSSVGGYAGLDGRVYAHSDGLASTDFSVFANNLSFQRQWWADDADGFALRADFAAGADYVAIDIIGDDPADIGALYAYDSGGSLLETKTSAELAYGQVFTAEINRPAFDIAYIIAGGSGSAETVHLDNLVVNIIPEPATVVLLAIGAIAIRKKKIE